MKLRLSCFISIQYNSTRKCRGPMTPPFSSTCGGLMRALCPPPLGTYKHLAYSPCRGLAGPGALWAQTNFGQKKWVVKMFG